MIANCDLPSLVPRRCGFTESPTVAKPQVVNGCLPETEMYSSEMSVSVSGGEGLFHRVLGSSVHPALHRASGAVARCSVDTGTSSCRLSASKHFRSSSTVDPITPDELAAMVETTITEDKISTAAEAGNDVTRASPVVIVDCRTFLAFNTNHVAGAFNASCGDRFSRRRLMQGRATAADLISGGPAPAELGGPREAYRRLADKVTASPSGVFVAYDDNTTDWEALQDSHPLRLLTTSLTGSGCRTKYLAGGLQAFYSSYSSLCSKPDEPLARPFLFSPTTPVVELDVDSAEMSCILPYLFVGNERDAADRQLLRDSGITHVLNVTSHVPLHFADDVTMTYLRIKASDSGCQNLKQYFDEIVVFIESARCSGGKVLVHCQAGVSRSPTLVVAYVMARYGRSLMDSFQMVKQRRAIVAPNFNFMGQLLEFEQRCRRGELRSSVDDRVPLPPLADVTLV